MTIAEIAHAFRRHYRDLNYLVDVDIPAQTLELDKDYQVIKLFTPQCRWIATLYLSPNGITYDVRSNGITHDARNQSVDTPLYDYADPQLIDQLDQLIADSHNRIPK